MHQTNTQLTKENIMAIQHDYHLHSDFSGDCSTPAALMAERALSLGLTSICFTEHYDIDVASDISFTVDFDAYFSHMYALQQQYGDRLKIRIGLEFGIQRHLAAHLKDLAGKYPFDFIIASHHFVGGEDPYYPAFFEGHSERSRYEQFFQEQFETLKKFDDFDTLGHMDYVVRYGPNQNRFYSYEAYADLIDPILNLLIEKGKCLEVNTGGLKYGLGDTNPCASVLKRYRQLGGERISIGSDAHVPEYLSYRFDFVRETLLALGFTHYTVFEQRRPLQFLL